MKRNLEIGASAATGAGSVASGAYGLSDGYNGHIGDAVSHQDPSLLTEVHHEQYIAPTITHHAGMNLNHPPMPGPGIVEHWTTMIPNGIEHAITTGVGVAGILTLSTVWGIAYLRSRHSHQPEMSPDGKVISIARPGRQRRAA